MNSFTPYYKFDRQAWSDLRNSTPLPLTGEELEQIKGMNTQISLTEVENAYLPLTRLIDYYFEAAKQLHRATVSFLGNHEKKVPFIIGIAGSVAVGKSTIARLLQLLLSRWGDHRKVDLVTTDGFLYANKILKEKGLMKKKGFPESYDIKSLIRFIAEVKAGKQEVRGPVYSHLTYDILEDEEVVVRQPDILIVEGINVLQVSNRHEVFVSDFFDFSLYVDAEEKDIKRWYEERFLLLRQTAFQNPSSYFRNYAELSDQEAQQQASSIWHEINARNLHENILPSRGRADLILEKGAEHEVHKVFLRKL